MVVDKSGVTIRTIRLVRGIYALLKFWAEPVVPAQNFIRAKGEENE